MPEERLVKAAEVSVFAHATEDEEKVKQAVKRVAKYETTFDSQRLTGHYEDLIILLTSKTVKKKEATDFLANIVNKLSILDKETLLQELPNRVDPQGNLYIRLDKQKAFHGRAVLNETDPIRVKFKFQLPHKADPVAVVRETIINLEDDDSE
jgi:RNA-binding protein